MRLLPRSLYGRLLALSVLITGLALVLAAFAIGHVLDRFVVSTVDQRLDDKLMALGATVRRDGSIDKPLIDQFYRAFQSDEQWRIDAPRGVAGSATIGGTRGISYAAGTQSLGSPATRHRLGPPRPRHGAPPDSVDLFGSTSAPFDSRLADGDEVHGRWQSVTTDAGLATVAVAVPRRMIDRPIGAMLAPLTLSLLLLGLALGGASLVQLRLGLRPLAALRRGVADIRHGTATRLPEDQPSELLPLATELNALLADNAAALEAARRHAANLAHGLKTPLATLALALRDTGRDPDGSLAVEVARIDRAVRHHLGRARAATPGGAARTITPLAPAVDGLVAALSRIHAERGIVATIAIDPALRVAVDAQDLDELLGNLLDNAWRFATTSLTVTARLAVDTRMIRLAIEDDGPGIPGDARAAAVAPGQRLDERGEGHGFGLAIARELAELYGGSLVLETASRGGLAAIVTLPDRPFIGV